MYSSETKLSCIKTELKRCTMTESLWNRCDIYYYYYYYYTAWPQKVINNSHLIVLKPANEMRYLLVTNKYLG